MKLHYFPTFSDSGIASDQVNRGIWYFDCILGASIHIYISGDFEYQSKTYFSSRLPEMFGSSIKSGKLCLNFVSEEQVVISVSLNDYLILWKPECQLTSEEASQLGEYRANGIKVFDVNSERRMEGSIYIEVSRHYYSADSRFLEESIHKYKRLEAKYSAANSSFVYCTGPSISEYKNYCYPNSAVKIICNTIIQDRDFMDEVQPDILVFADPIFHFGCSSYTESFQKKLRETVIEYDLDIVIPIKYYALFCHSLPDLAIRTIPLPYREQDDFNLDLAANFEVKTTDNILTFLMLPLATSLTKEINIIGCDGRPLEEDDYFWGHNSKTQISDKMVDIQKAHPSFFQLEYNEYYLSHCDNLEKLLSQGESAGHEYTSFSFSHIPALKSREYQYRMLASRNSTNLYISINPDAMDSFGHYFHYDCRLNEELDVDEDLIVLANVACSFDSEGPMFREVFSTRSINTRWTRDVDTLSLWRSELNSALYQLSFLARPKVVYMYTGAITYFVDFLLASTNRDLYGSFTFKFNLFYAHMDYAKTNFIGSERYITYQKIFDMQKIYGVTNIEILCDSDRLARLLERDFQYKIRRWPMIGVTDLSVVTDPEKEGEAIEKNVVVSFPGNGQFSKGFDLMCDLLNSYDEQPEIDGVPVNFLVRDQLRDNELNNAHMLEKLNLLRIKSWVTIIAGHLDDNEYINMFHNADIVVLPYRSSAFYSRTSGCLVDAAMLGKKVIAFRNTWLGELVLQLDLGACIDEGDQEIVDIKRAIASLVAKDRETTDVSLKRIHAEFSPKNLKNMLREKAELDTVRDQTLLNESILIELSAHDVPKLMQRSLIESDVAEPEPVEVGGIDISNEVGNIVSMNVSSSTARIRNFLKRYPSAYNAARKVRSSLKSIYRR